MILQRSIFEEGQKVRNEILANGGTYEEARKAYLEKISVSKKNLEQFNQNDPNEEIENNEDVEKNNEETSEDRIINYNIHQVFKMLQYNRIRINLLLSIFLCI